MWHYIDKHRKILHYKDTERMAIHYIDTEEREQLEQLIVPNRDTRYIDAERFFCV